jgi:phosphoribosylglycinamide formyltransferase 1
VAEGRPQAALLDRDGTIIVDHHYTNDPAQVELLPGAAEAIRRLAAAGIPSIVCTNQSGIARGTISIEQYRAVRLRMEALLAAEGATLLDTFSCPHHPDVTGPCDCRKPATGLYERAAAVHRLDLSRCFYAGDRYRDVAACTVFRGRGVFVESRVSEPADRDRAVAEGMSVAASLLDGVRALLGEPRRTRARIAVLASGGGSNLQALLDYFTALGERRAGDVVLVASDRADAGALARARAAGIETTVVSPDGAGLAALLDAHAVDLVVLAGYLKFVPVAVTRRFAGRIVNVHPALLPQFGGPGMYGTRVHRAVLAARAPVSGPTVHFVDEVYDHGAVIAQWRVPVHPTDDEQSLAARVLRAEHLLFPRVVQAVAAGDVRLTAEGRVDPPFVLDPDTLSTLDPELDDGSLAGELQRVRPR